MTTRILLVDDHAIVREGLIALLEREGFAVVGQAADGMQAVQLAKELHPEVVILDFGMPILNGLDAARAIREALPTTRLVLLTMHTDEQYVLEGLRAGIRGFVLKTQAAAELVRAIRDVQAGAVFLGPGMGKTVVDAYLNGKPEPTEHLTPRERQVLQLVAEGRTTKEIARLLGVGVKTAESHRTHLMEKLGIHDTAGLVRYAIRKGFVQL
jgi:two-component system response regulator NreC